MTAAPVPGLEPAFEVEVVLGPLEDHGPTRRGHRRVVPIVGGSVRGAFDAEILPGGADWQIVRDDGAIEVDARYTARTADAAHVLIHATGVRSGPPDVLEALLRGEPVDPSAYYFRTVVTLEASSTELASLQNSIFVASAVRTADRVTYTAYRVT
ncbi:DUF3237 domain-containing protein [Microbacterium pumilum]|uniref:UPF0311 protein GCM10009777_01410 n=1 Tax=Microbacterium pumilum TaxID=344165 RepID=A0ABN2RQ96_9MICO